VRRRRGAVERQQGDAVAVEHLADGRRPRRPHGEHAVEAAATKGRDGGLGCLPRLGSKVDIPVDSVDLQQESDHPVEHGAPVACRRTEDRDVLQVANFKLRSIEEPQGFAGHGAERDQVLRFHGRLDRVLEVRGVKATASTTPAARRRRLSVPPSLMTTSVASSRPLSSLANRVPMAWQLLPSGPVRSTILFGWDGLLMSSDTNTATAISAQPATCRILCPRCSRASAPCVAIVDPRVGIRARTDPAPTRSGLVA
jgi:hypothetical protein